MHTITRWPVRAPLCQQGTSRRFRAAPILARGARLLLVSLLLAVPLNLVFPVTPVHAATIVVNSTKDEIIAGDGKCTLREAINNANADADTTGGDCAPGTGADKIGLQAATYNLKAGSMPVEDANASDDLDVLATGGDLTLTGKGSANTVISGPGVVVFTNRVLHINPGGGACDITVRVSGLTIENGYTGQGGGGIRNNRCTLQIADSVITGNSAVFAGGASNNGNGGGIYSDDGELKMVRSSVVSNEARGAVVTEIRGGGLYIAGGSAQIEDSVVADNEVTIISAVASAGYGGGLYNAGANVQIEDTTISGHSIMFSSHGGGIYNEGALAMDGCTIFYNAVYLEGGAIHNAAGGTADIDDSTLSGNYAENGGAIYHAGSDLDIDRTTLAGNYAVDGYGGGLYNAAPSKINDSTFSGNEGTRGGGVYSIAAADITNSTLSANGAERDGGGIRNWGGKVTLINVTVTRNSAHTPAGSSGDGGGIANADGTVNLKNSLVAENFDLSPSGNVYPDVAGAFISDGYNLIGDGTGSTGLVHGVGNDQVGTSASPIDPRLGPLAGNGGPTLTHALQRASPAVDKGTCTGAPPADQRGWVRPDPRSLLCDVGAYELGILAFLPAVRRD
jgi:CSLREA domain-containing protein